MQSTLPREVLDIIKDLALNTWEKINSMIEYSANFLTTTQGTFESHTDFLGRLQDVLKIEVNDQDMRKFLEKTLAYHNVSDKVY